MKEEIFHVAVGIVVGLLNNRSWIAFAALYCGTTPRNQQNGKIGFLFLKSLVVLMLVVYFSYFGTANLLYFAAGFFVALLPLFLRRPSGNTK